MYIRTYLVMITINKNNDKYKIVSNFNLGIFIDSSESTADRLRTIDKRIIEIEKQFVKYLTNYRTNCKIRYVHWSKYATEIDNIDKISSSGGTYPSCIFENTAEIYNDSDIFIILTDGYINSYDAITFDKNISNAQTKSFGIGVIISDEVNVDISVLAPLFKFPQALILQYDGNETARILYKNGISEVEHVDYIKCVDILDIKVNFTYLTLPTNSIIINETDEYITYITYEEFISGNLDIDIYRKLDWESVCRNAKISGQLKKIRALVDHLKNKDVMEVYDKFEQNIKQSSFHKKRREIISKINDAISQDLPYDELSKSLHNMILDSNQEINEQKMLRNNIANSKKIWNEVYRLLHYFDNSTYKIESLIKIANRVKRASFISEDENNFIITYDDKIPTINCVICLCNGPTVLWFSTPSIKQLEIIYKDFVLDCPLGLRNDIYDEIFSNIVANPVCGNCAEDYLAVSNLSVYRVPIIGFIPINWISNYYAARTYLYKCMTEGKILPHIETLLYSYIDLLVNAKAEEKKWMSNNMTEFRSYFIHQMQNSIMINHTFLEDGTQVTLYEAACEFPSNDISLFRQTVNGVTRIFSIKHGQNLLVNHFVDHTHLQRRIIYHYIQQYSYLLKIGKKGMIQSHINSILYKTWCDNITVCNEDDIHELNHSKLIIDDKLGLKEPTPHYYDDILCILEPNIIRYLLYFLKDRCYSKPLSLFELYICISKDWRKLSRNELYRELVGHYYKRNAVNNPEQLSPCYAFYNGLSSSPSKFYYNKIYLGNDIKIAKSKMQSYLVLEYGNNCPNSRSAHISLHKIVADILESEYKDHTDFCPKMMLDVLDAIKLTYGEKGNIFINRIKTILLCIIDFIAVRNEYNAYDVKWYINNFANFIEKAECEQIVCKDNNGIKFRGMLEERYASLDIDDLLNKVQIAYNALNK